MRDERWENVNSSIYTCPQNYNRDDTIVETKVLYDGVSFNYSSRINSELAEDVPFDLIPYALDESVRRIDEMMDELSRLEVTCRFNAKNLKTGTDDSEFEDAIKRTWYEKLANLGINSPESVPYSLSRKKFSVSSVLIYSIRWSRET